MPYCENCGFELTSLFCEYCGSVSTLNIPNSLSNDDSIAGLLTAVIKNGKPLLFSELLALTNSRDRTFRIFSQLEKTNNFLLVKQAQDFLISLNAFEENLSESFDWLKVQGKIALLKDLLELFPLSLDDINSIFPVQVTIDEFQTILGKNYQLTLTKQGKYISKKK